MTDIGNAGRLQTGDVVLVVGGTELNGDSTLGEIIERCGSSDTSTFLVFRDL